MNQNIKTIEIDGVKYHVSKHYEEQGENVLEKVARLIEEEVKKRAVDNLT